jgi:hypothetical protein
MRHKNGVKVRLIHPMMYGWFEYGVGWHEVDEDLANYFLERKPASAVPYIEGSEAKPGSITPPSRTVADDPEDIIRDIRLITEEIGQYEQKIRSSHRRPEHRPEYVTQITALRTERTRLKALLELQRVETRQKPLPQKGATLKPATLQGNSVIANVHGVRQRPGTVEATANIRASGTTKSTNRTKPLRRARSTKVNVPGKDRVRWYRSLHKWKDEDGASVIDKTTGRLNYSYDNLYETIFVEIFSHSQVPLSCDWNTPRTASCARAWDAGDSSRRKKMRDWIRRLVRECSLFRDQIIETH